jgi:hypothetical protein
MSSRPFENRPDGRRLHQVGLTRRGEGEVWRRGNLDVVTFADFVNPA